MLEIALAALALVGWLTLLAVAGGRDAIPGALRRLTRGAPDPVRRAAAAFDALGVVGLIGVWLWLSLNPPSVVDATVYWAIDLDNLYGQSVVNRVGAYLYSPVFAQVAAPFTNVPWAAWYSGWAAINLALLAWMLRPGAALLTLAFPAVSHALWSGNIHFLMAAAAVLAVRRPIAWAFPLLTKVTPGVGILWHAARREWRSLGIALGATAVIALASFAVAPHLWGDWLRVLTASSSEATPNTLLPLPLAARVGLAAAIVLIGGVRGWAWTIPVAMVIAQPLFWTAGLAALVAVVPLSRLPAGPAASDGVAPAASSSAARRG